MTPSRPPEDKSGRQEGILGDSDLFALVALAYASTSGFGLLGRDRGGQQAQLHPAVGRFQEHRPLAGFRHCAQPGNHWQALPLGGENSHIAPVDPHDQARSWPQHPIHSRGKGIPGIGNLNFVGLRRKAGQGFSTMTVRQFDPIQAEMAQIKTEMYPPIDPFTPGMAQTGRIQNPKPHPRHLLQITTPFGHQHAHQTAQPGSAVPQSFQNRNIRKITDPYQQAPGPTQSQTPVTDRKKDDQMQQVRCTPDLAHALDGFALPRRFFQINPQLFLHPLPSLLDHLIWLNRVYPLFASRSCARLHFEPPWFGFGLASQTYQRGSPLYTSFPLKLAHMLPASPKIQEQDFGGGE